MFYRPVRFARLEDTVNRSRGSPQSDACSGILTMFMATRYVAMYRVYVFVFQVVYRVVATDTTWYDSGGEGKPSCSGHNVVLIDTRECSEAIVQRVSRSDSSEDSVPKR